MPKSLLASLPTSSSPISDKPDMPSICLKGTELEELLKQNQLLIKNSKEVLHRVLDRLIIEGKVIFLCDKNGYVANIIGEAANVQYFFEHEFKLGTSMTEDSIGKNAVGEVLKTNKISVVNTQQHSMPALQQWTAIAAPIMLQDKLNGVICIYLQISQTINQCKLIIELISDYVTVLLKHCTKKTVDKSRFFGFLILNNQFNFTPKEIEILYHLKSGDKIVDLPAKLTVSHNTVKTHVKNIYSKMGANNLDTCMRILDDCLIKGVNDL